MISDPILRLIDPKQVQVTATLPVADTTRFVIGATARAIAEDPLAHGRQPALSEGRDPAPPRKAARRPSM